MFKQGDVVRVKNRRGKHLVCVDFDVQYPFVQVTNDTGNISQVHVTRVSKAKVKKVTGVYQLVKRDTTKIGDSCVCLCFDGSETMPCIGSLGHVSERAEYLRAYFPQYTYVVQLLTVTPKGTTAIQTDY